MDFIEQEAMVERAVARALSKAAEPKTLTRVEFEAKSPADRAAYIARGGRVVDADVPKPKAAVVPEGAISRSAFDNLSPTEKDAHIKNGGKVVDVEKQA